MSVGCSGGLRWTPFDGTEETLEGGIRSGARGQQVKYKEHIGEHLLPT